MELLGRLLGASAGQEERREMRGAALLTVLLLQGAVVSCLTDSQVEEGDLALPGLPFSAHPQVSNLFLRIAEREIGEIGVLYDSGQRIQVTNRTDIGRCCTSLRQLRFRRAWVTMTCRPSPSEQSYLGTNGCVVARTIVNTREGEVLLCSEDGEIAGVAMGADFHSLIESWRPAGAGSGTNDTESPAPVFRRLRDPVPSFRYE